MTNERAQADQNTRSTPAAVPPTQTDVRHKYCIWPFQFDFTIYHELEFHAIVFIAELRTFIMKQLKSVT
jgi:hypothetical protein